MLGERSGARSSNIAQRAARWRRTDRGSCRRRETRRPNRTRTGLVRLEFERQPTAPTMAASSCAASVENPDRRGIAVLRRAGHHVARSPRCCRANAHSSPWRTDRDRPRAERVPEHRMERALRQAAVTHAGEDIEALHRDPIGGAFVAEHLAPAPCPRGSGRGARRSRSSRCRRRC